MFIIDLHYVVPFEEVQKHMSTHLEHLDKYYDQTFLLAGAPKCLGPAV